MVTTGYFFVLLSTRNIAPRTVLTRVAWRHAPTVQPSHPPVLLATAADGDHNCTWLMTLPDEEQQTLCNSTDGAAYSVCPEACGACVDYCEDSGDGIFVYNGTEHDCQWLASNPQVQEEVCYHWNGAWTVCKDTCNHWSCGLSN